MSNRILDFCERNLKWLLPTIFVCTAILTVGLFTLHGVAESVKLSYITAVYEGDTKAGTVLDSDNPGFIVTAYKKDGTSETVTSWTIPEPKMLENASDTTVVIVYGNCSTLCTIHCTTGYISAITAEYDGDTESGVSLDATNPGIHVFAIRSGGEKIPLEKGWHIVKPTLLSSGATSTVQISYEDLTCTLSVQCTSREIRKLTAEYSGSTEEGVFIGSGNKGMTVTAWYSEDESEVVSGWTLAQNVTLEPRERYLLEVHYREAVCLVEVVCTSPTMEEYASDCASLGYIALRTFPDSYRGQKVTVSGTLRDISLKEDGSVMLTVEVQADLLGLVRKDVAVRYTSTLHGELPPEGSEVTVYGTAGGLYENEEGLESMPLIEGEYVISQER